MTQKKKTAIQPTRSEDYAAWYQEVIKAADLAENAAVRGCMIIKPWGWSIWENIRDILDKRIKETGHQNVYFPLFIPLSFLQKEADHLSGFAKECAVVTHHRLEEHGGKLCPAGPLEEPLVVRPTSEAIIGDAFSRWIQSYRDLPLVMNQWANVVRWEMRPRLFLRTSEFLWQEGHTAHETEKEAEEETLKMLGMYREFVEGSLAIPAVVGKKSEGEKFPGAVDTYTLEAMMQDGKALQLGTSHYLGQNFAKSFNIRFNARDEELEYVYTTSWGITTRLIGALIMTHSDDDGLRLPPKIAPYHVVILPVIPKDESRESVMQYVAKIKHQIEACSFNGHSIVVHVDDRDMRGGEKKWYWVKKGTPLRIEVGPRDVEKGQFVLCRRDQEVSEKAFITLDDIKNLPEILDKIHEGYFSRAKTFLQENIVSDLTTLDEMKAFFAKEEKGALLGFVRAKWCKNPETEEKLKELKITIRCLPLDQSGTEGTCILTGKPATCDAIFAKAY